jgi:hypothetical protein
MAARVTAEIPAWPELEPARMRTNFDRDNERWLGALYFTHRRPLT